MTQNINLKELEKKAFRSTFQDGLWNIFLGIILMAMAVNTLLSRIGVSGLETMAVFISLEVVAIIVLFVGKRRITVPRIGHVKFSSKRRAKLTKVRLVLALSVIAGLVVFFVAAAMRGNASGIMSPGILFPLGWMANALIVFGLMAHFMDFPRLYIIGVLYAITLPIDRALYEFAGIKITYIVFGIPAAIILVMGFVLLSLFLRDNPLLEEVVEP